ncbi:acyl-CoA-binding domain-containing protein 4 isoform X2 [Entelurus aequoreus]|uniref:acyl-CoA-binding domain-containing protein 4 isoform X2 n=1 Tax=Entelurus aequoreus TaxID=161455 RepID=UPI002B1E2882|nr:acyl-CoA-binding domain-containing protein 4 isoform X2 [Entelurus aequoreus]
MNHTFYPNGSTMPDTVMAESVVDYHTRFQAAVDVIHKLPKNGSYRPSYEVMLRFYSLYKQAVCGPCAVSRPGFWDPVGHYKWDAWSRLGDMSTANAMAAYVDELKKVAQEVIDTMPINEKTASLFHHFEPLYVVIDDMPRPPPSLLRLREGSGQREGLVLNSDSENEIFCDSVDSVEQLSNLKIHLVKSNGLQNGHEVLESSLLESPKLKNQYESRQVGAGHGGEGGKDAKDRDTNGSRASGQEGSYHNRRESGVPPSRRRRGVTGGAGGDERAGGDGSDDVPESGHETHLQHQIILALRKLKYDMRIVMARLEVVERLTTTHASGPEWRPCLQCASVASPHQEKKWWPFDLSCQTVLLFMLWPFAAQGMIHLLKKIQRRSQLSS